MKQERTPHMVTATRVQTTSPIGHIATYAAGDRRRQAIGRALDAAGHSYREAGTPQELRRNLDYQRFDVGVWVVREDSEAEAIGDVLAEVKLPLHSIVVGAASALPHMKRRRGGTLRLVPSTAPAGDIARLAGASISQGGWDEPAAQEEPASDRELVELEDIIEHAATAVYAQAKRKRQSFRTFVSAEEGHVLGSRSKLRKIFTSLLKVVVDLAPVGTSIATNAIEQAGEWQISIGAANGSAVRRPLATTASDLTDEREALKAVSEEIRDQGGIMWVELAGPAALSICFTLPIPVEALQHA